MQKVKTKRNKYISNILRFIIAGIALYFAFRGEDIRRVTEVLLGLNLWIFAAALGLYIISQLVFVLRWSILLKVQSIRIGFPTAARLHFLGLFYNNCLPGSVGGDLLRAWYVTKHTDKKLEAALSVFVDRVIGLVGILIMAFFCYWFIPVAGQRERINFSYKINFLDSLAEYRWVFLGIGLIFWAFIIIFVSSAKGREFLDRSYKIIRRRAVGVLGKVQNAIKIYYNKKLAIALALVLTFYCQGIFVIGMWLIGKQIGVTAHMKYYFIFFPISWLLGTLPISVGGLGVMEGWLKVIFSQACGVPGDKALALALGQRLLWLIGSLPGAVIHLVGAHLPKDFFIDYEKPIK